MSWRKNASSSAGVIVIGIGALTVPRGDDFGTRDGPVDGGVELVDNRLRRPARRHQAKPDRASNPGTRLPRWSGRRVAPWTRGCGGAQRAQPGRPERWDAMVVMASNIISIWPPMTALRLSPALVRHMTMSVPVIS